MTPDPSEQEVVLDFKSLLRQADSQPEFTPGDVAMLEWRLGRFDEIVRAAYLQFETYPGDSKTRKQWRRKLLGARWQIRNAIRFSLRFGTPCDIEVEQLNRLEYELLAAFPDVEPVTVQH